MLSEQIGFLAHDQHGESGFPDQEDTSQDEAQNSEKPCSDRHQFQGGGQGAQEGLSAAAIGPKDEVGRMGEL